MLLGWPGFDLAAQSTANDFQYPIHQSQGLLWWNTDISGGGWFDGQDFQHLDTSLQTAGGPQYKGRHLGEDWNYSNGNAGQLVYATANGVVVRSAVDSGLAGFVILKHLLPEGGYVLSIYGHLHQSDYKPSQGQVVTKGQVIGRLATRAEMAAATGNPSYPYESHFHFEIRASSAQTGLLDTYVNDGYSPNPPGYFDPSDAKNYYVNDAQGRDWNPAIGFIEQRIPLPPDAATLIASYNTQGVFSSTDARRADTRGEFAAVLVNAMKVRGNLSLPLPGNAHPFSDLIGHPFEDKVATLVAMGAVSTSNSIFRVNDQITRGEALVIAHSCLEYFKGRSPDAGTTRWLYDLSASRPHPFYSSLQKCVAQGLTAGLSQQMMSRSSGQTLGVAAMLLPNAPARRGDTVRMMENLLGAAATAAKPNLTPYMPTGWSDKIVVSNVTGTTSDSSPLRSSDSLFLDWAVQNGSSTNITSTFQTELYVDGVLKTSWNVPSLAATGYASLKDFSLGNLSAGSHVIKIKVDAASAITETDETDNEFTKTITIAAVADTSAPTLTIANPSTDGASYSSAALAVNGTATDDTGVSSVFVRLNGGAWIQATGTSSWSSSVALAPGINTIEAYARDAAFNTSSIATRVVSYTPADVTIPSVAISNPAADGLVVSNSAFSFSGTASDNVGVASVFVRINSGGWVQASGTAAWSSSMTLLAGVNLLEVYARDAAGNASAITGRTVNYSPPDSTAPSATISNPAANGLTVATASLALAGSASDNVGVTAVFVRLNGGAWTQASGTTSWSLSVSLAAGSNYIEVYSRDAAANTSPVVNRTVTYSATATDDHGDTFGTATVVAADSTTAGVIGVPGDVDFFRVNVTGDGVLTVRSTGSSDTEAYFYGPDLVPLAYNDQSGGGNNFLISSPVAAGSYYVAVRGWNQSLGSYALESSFVASDTTVPTLAIISPASSGSTVTSSTLTVSGSASDNVAVTSVSLRVNGGAWMQVGGTSSWSGQVTLSAGSNLIEAYASDAASNASLTASRTITYQPADTTAPSVVIVAPAEGTVVTTSSVALSGTATDNVGVTAVFARVNGGAWTQATGTSTWSANVSLISGSNLVEVYAKDAAANSSPIIARTVVRNSTALVATFSSASSVPVTASSYSASGKTVSFVLNYAPSVGTSLTVVKNTGLGFISGTFSNLAQGQRVTLTYAGSSYEFIAHYYGGTGNDLVLLWANALPYGWGTNAYGSVGSGGVDEELVPVPVRMAGVLSGKRVVAMAAGGVHTLALCADGTLAAWGYNAYGQLGNGGRTSSSSPVAVDMSGVLQGKRVVAVAAGGYHSVVLCSDGTMAAWGYNTEGELGNNSMVDSPTPVAVTISAALAGKTVVSVACGYSHNVALCSDGSCVTWGFNSDGQLGTSPVEWGWPGSMMQSSVPVAVNTTAGVSALAGKSVKSIAAGTSHCLALCSDGTLVAWGTNMLTAPGQQGSALVPTAVYTGGALSGKVVIAMAAGGHHDLVLCSDGTVLGWGWNTDGQLGSLTEGGNELVPVNTQAGVSALYGRSVVSLSAGYKHSLAYCSDGSVVAWGERLLGNGSTEGSPVPVLVSSAPLGSGDRFTEAITGFFAGHSFSLVASAQPMAPLISVTDHFGSVMADGTATAAFGSVTPGEAVFRTFTIENRGVTDLANLAVTFDGPQGAAFSVATTPVSPVPPSGSTSLTVRFCPTAVGACSAVMHITSNVTGSTNPFDVALSGNGSGPFNAIYATGGEVPFTDDHFRVTGNTVSFTLNFAPPTGSNLMVLNNTGLDFIEGTFSNLAQGERVSLSYGGRTYDFVANYYGGTGNDLVLQWARTRPVAWGEGQYGSLGNGATSSSSVPVPVDTTGVLAGKNILSTSVGGYHCVVLCSDGSMATWGLNQYSGALGNGSLDDSALPVAVRANGALAGKHVVSVSAGGFHSVALCSDGAVVTWGWNSNGQLGVDGVSLSTEPTLVEMRGALLGKHVVAVSAGSEHTLALCSDGTVAAWGYNNHGQLGCDTGFWAVPAAVKTRGILSGRRVMAIQASGMSSYALCADGVLAGWGYNDSGELGSGVIGPDYGSWGRCSNHPVAADLSALAAGSKVVAFFTGGALCSDGTRLAWGWNGSGGLGNNSTTDSLVPIPVPPLGHLVGRTIISLTGTGATAYAICSDGTLASWGDNWGGKLGNGSTADYSTVPVAVSMTSLAAGERFVPGFTAGDRALALVAMPPAQTPLVTTLAASSIKSTSAVINGRVNANNLASTTTFEYGTNVPYAGSTSLATVLNGNTANDVSITLTGLTPGATYHYRLVATNAAGANSGSDIAFTTPVAALDVWRMQTFATYENSGVAADAADADGDGIANLAEFALGLNPKRSDVTSVPQARIADGKLTLSFAQPAGVSGIAYGAEASETLLPGSWTDVANTGVWPNYVFSVPTSTSPRLFLRLKFTPLTAPPPPPPLSP